MPAVRDRQLPSIDDLRRQTAEKLHLPLDRVPRHIAIIMDGNGRWALHRGLPREEGHRVGAEAARRIITRSAELGLEVLTLFSFSLENWKRPSGEIDALMTLAVEHLVGEREELRRNNIRVIQIGRRDRLPEVLLTELDRTIAATVDCTGTTLALALNYGSRAEITDAMRAIGRKIQARTLDPDDITESLIARHLYTSGLPDPDLLIRTAGEYRISNYLLWQLSYAEIHVTDVLWPDFGADDLERAIRDYASRDRRFGAVDSTPS